MSTKTISINADKYAQAFVDLWLPHMQNGGRSESGPQLKRERERIYDKLRPLFPVESECLDEYRRLLSRRGVMGGSADTTGNDRAEAGKVVMYRLASKMGVNLRPRKEKKVAPKNKVGRPRRADQEAAKARYIDAVSTYHEMPPDAVCATLLGSCSEKTVGQWREELGDRYLIEANGWGWLFTDKPKPPSLIERVRERLANLRQEELEALEELLSEEK